MRIYLGGNRGFIEHGGVVQYYAIRTFGFWVLFEPGRVLPIAIRSNLSEIRDFVKEKTKKDLCS